jgi:hypothetical protein
VNLLARAIFKSASTMEGMSMAPFSDVGYDNIYLLVKKGISIFYLVFIEKRGKLPISDIQTPHEHRRCASPLVLQNAFLTLTQATALLVAVTFQINDTLE